MERKRMIKIYWADCCPGHPNCGSCRTVIFKSHLKYLLKQPIFKYHPDFSPCSLWQASTYQCLPSLENNNLSK